MAQSSRTFRVFVSSTFSDLKAERNALQEKVFPRLRDLAASHGCRFQAIDLRWGISEEAALDQQTMKICLGEIERSQKTSPRPNFIVLLGDRYGWRPIPSEIPADEFEQIIPLAASEGRAQLKQWYRRDDNAVPPVYCLLPRTGKFVDHEAWEKVETDLRQVFLSAIGKLSLSSEALLKYTASATEQEIVAGAFRVKDANEHVFCFLRDIQMLPADASAAAFSEIDPQAARRQSELKERLRQSLLGNIHEYSAHWQGDGPSLRHLDQLCEDVYAELSRVILAETGNLETIDPLDSEISAHEGFGKERARIFVGRANILAEIEKYITGNDPHPLAIWGTSGSGKSALLAKAVEQTQKNGQDVLYRFIGATPESSNGRALLESLCKQISHRYEAGESILPHEYKELVQELAKRLALAKPDKPLILFLDALDQLSDADNARNLTWLPSVLSANVRLVVSTLPGECLQALERDLPAENILEVQPMSVQEGKQILTEWLSGVNRQLEKKQEEHLLVKFQQCRLPLYLKLVFEEARLWKSYQALPELSGDIPGILRDLFKRLSQESNHGSMLVSRSLGYLAAAKNGLSENELLDVLSADLEVQADFLRRSPKSPKSDQLPVVIWSRLYFDLEPYLTKRSADGTSLLAFYHRQMAEACHTTYRDTARHIGLARYFSPRSLYLDKDKRTINQRKTSEQVYQQRQAEMWEALYTTLTDFDFLEGRCQAASIYDLEEDYRLALQGWHGKKENILEAFQERLRLESHAISKTPELLFPQLYNHLTWQDAPDGPLHTLCEQAAEQHHGWLRMTQNPLPKSHLWLRSLEGHISDVNAVVVTPDGKRIVSGSRDSTIKVWDLPTGRLLRSLEGHTGRVNTVAVTPDGQQIVSGSGDHTIKVWDLPTGRLLRSLEEHTFDVTAVTVTPDGKQIVSGSSDHTIKVWDLTAGRLLYSIDGHSHGVTAVAVTPDGKQVVSGAIDGIIKIWDLATGHLFHAIEGQKAPVNTVAVTPDGKKIISGSWDKTVKIWDLRTGLLLRSLEGHTCLVKAVAVTPDGSQVVSGSDDKTIKIWDLATGRLHRSLEKHTYYVNAVATTPDGKQVVSGSDDNTIKVWDLTTGLLLRSLEGHRNSVNAVAVTPDGTQVVSSSNDRTLKVWDLPTGRLLQSLEEHSESNAVVVTPDGQQFVSGSTDSIVRVWDLATGHLLRTFEGHGGRVNTVAITSGGQQIVSGSDDKTIKIWDLVTGQLLHTLEGHSKGVTAVAVAPDGKRIVSGSIDATIKIWDLATGRLLRSLEGHTDRINAVAVTPDGKQIASGSRDNTIKVWDLQSGRLLRSVEGHGNSVNAVTITPDGKQIVSGSWDNTVKIWDLATGHLQRTIEGQTMINAVTVTPDGTQIVSGSVNKTIKVWDLDVDPLLRSVEGHRGPVNAVAITPDGSQAATGSTDNTIKVWDLATGRLHRSIEGQTIINALAITPDGAQIVSGAYDETIKIWDLATGSLLHSLEDHTRSVNAVAITPDGKQIVSGSDDKIIKIWDLATGSLLHSLEGHISRVKAVAVTPDGQQFVSAPGGKQYFYGSSEDYSGSPDNIIKVWDLSTGSLHHSLEGLTQWVNAVAVTPDGKQVISASGDATIKVWNLQSGRLLRTLEGHTHGVTTVTVTPDGLQVVSGSNDKTIRVWLLASGKSQPLFQNNSAIHCIASDGHWLICGDAEGHVWIFEWMK